MSDIFEITKNYIDNYIFLNNHYLNMIHYMMDHNIDKRLEYINIQDGGDYNYKTKIENKEYSIDYYKTNDAQKIKKNPNEFSLFLSLEPDLKNFYSLNLLENVDNKEYVFVYIYNKNKKNNCVVLNYYNRDILNIVSIESDYGYYNNNDKERSGDILMKIIINYAKDKGFKKIELEDKSKYDCKRNDKSNNLTYNLTIVHILCNGYSWYHKYGFKYINDNENKNAENNKLILDKIKTKHFSFEKIIFLMTNKMINSHLDFIYKDKNLLFLLQDLSQIYLNYKNKPIYDFFSYITKNYCDLIALLNYDIFMNLKLTPHNDKRMRLVL